MSYLEKCPQKDPNIVSRMIADEVILVPIRQNVGDLESFYTLNEVGAFIWDLINGKRQAKDIKEMLIEEFEVSEEEAGENLIEFIKQLEEISAIVLVKK